MLRAQQVYNTNSYLEDVIYFLDEINMQFQPWINYAIANSWNLILNMKVEIPSLKFNFINGLVKRWNLNFKMQLLHLVQKKPIKHYAKPKKWAWPTTALQIYWTANLWSSLPTLIHFNQTSIYFNLKSGHSIEAILMSIRRHLGRLSRLNVKRT